jgi:ABC-type branched-subunit amino acid transport system permease subunit
MENVTISNLAFGGVFLVIALGVFGVVSFKHAAWFGVGLVAVGLATKPGSLNNT